MIPYNTACTVPGQTAMLQNFVCFSGPSQGSPPNCGGVQVRVRDLKPLPQVDEHKLHGDHSSQAPCTVIRAAWVVGFVNTGNTQHCSDNINLCWIHCCSASLEKRKLKPLSWNRIAAEQRSLPGWQRLVELGNTIPYVQYSRDFQKCRQRCFWKGRNRGLWKCQR